MINELFIDRHIECGQVVIGLDFDGTVVKHAYPKVGETLPKCVEYLQEIVSYGGLIVLNTMRGSDTIQDAINWFEKNRIKLYGVNKNPTQLSWTDSPKPNANIYIDDAAYGCPVTASGYVNWSIVGPDILNLVKKYYNKKVR